MKSIGIFVVALWLTHFCDGGQLGARIYSSGSESSVLLFDQYINKYAFTNGDVKIIYEGKSIFEILSETYVTDFNIFDRAISQDNLDMFQIVQFPLAGQAIVMTYNLPELVNSSYRLVIDRETLGKIWYGAISKWNDTAIQNLNPSVGHLLPDTDIILGYSDDYIMTISGLIKMALSSFSPEFDTELKYANNTFNGMNPTKNGRGHNIGETSTVRLEWLKKTSYGLTYINYADVYNNGTDSTVPMNMYNKAGYFVEPNLVSVQAAMSDFKIFYANNNSTIDIYDAPGNKSWPLAYVNYLGCSSAFGPMADCTRTIQMTNFIAWIYTNDAASESAIELQFYPLDKTLQKVAIDNLYNIKCNNIPVLSQQYLIGFGAPISVMSLWPNSWTTVASTARYYSAPSSQALELQETYGADFGITVTGVPNTYFNKMPDLGVMPLAAFTIVPAYNIPAINGTNGTLILDYEIITDIYLGIINNWNDSRIRALNGIEINRKLPNVSITVIYQAVSSDYNFMFTDFMSKKSPKFAKKIGSTYFPILTLPNNSMIITTDIYDVGNQLISNSNSFAFWPYFGITMLSRQPTVQAASIRTEKGNIISSNSTTLEKAINNFISKGGSIEDAPYIMGENDESWPLSALMTMIYRQSTIHYAAKAAAVADFAYWTQSNPTAINIATIQGMYVASSNPTLKSRNLNLLKNFVVDGEPISSIANCIYQGTICSDMGTCNNNSCLCNSYRKGIYCENIVSSSGESIGIILAIVIPVSFVICCIIIVLVIALIVSIRLHQRVEDEWEVDFHELDFMESLGSGGSGEVFKAMWKGTEVAVKKLVNSNITKDAERNFKQEIHRMTSLRHPNVVLFMAASTRPPNMCIVMEFMSLGSLYDLLGNELVTEIPPVLRIRIAYQAAKGMHFLHSSDIVHRDLKSLNLLLDSKWNVKVSDFGLTKIKDNNKGKSSTKEDSVCSIQWTAPEVLSEKQDIDYILADVYSFGIIMWELMTRLRPYIGLSPAAIAVAVIRDNLRPEIQEEDINLMSSDYVELVNICWHKDTMIRPSFLEIMTKLSTLIGGSGITTGTSTSSSNQSSDYIGPNIITRTKNIHNNDETKNSFGSTTYGSNTISSSSNTESDKILSKLNKKKIPTGEVIIVFTDIISAEQLWHHNPLAMKNATVLYNSVIRETLDKIGGYESFIYRDHNSGEGSFCLVFQEAIDAIDFCSISQKKLLEIDWPEELLDHPAAASEKDINGTMIFAGPRVRMGLHAGTVKIMQDPVTRRYEYSGVTVNIAAKITMMTHGGQVIMSEQVTDKISNNDCSNIKSLGQIEITDTNNYKVNIFELKIEGLIGRFFGGVAFYNYDSVTESTDLDDTYPDSLNFSTNGILYGGIKQENEYLSSAGLCRWIINYDDIQIGKQIGVGSYGIVNMGKWKNINVAVKKFVKQKIDEKQMLEFRAEIAFLSQLRHPHIILMIGACLKRPNICIVTEFMGNGSLRNVIKTTKPEWKLKIKMLYQTALGIGYLHNSDPIIIHRDIKPSNILVDDSMNVKIADFGFARIKEENSVMTRCGTPCWTAPEIIRGEKYTEKVDVFSFGIVMWEVLTCKEPFSGCNFMKVSMDILEGARPQIPSDCPIDFTKLMKQCWHAKPDKRPSMEDVIMGLNDMLGPEKSL
ncbi:putative serine/threonine-protein kinase/receptor [Acanthamoeba polyphaga mimivirus]|nr:putative serine/threonine-protein kinase/receptor [Mimivirus reunion]WMV62202.1 putative serine/threonine-protein kinase/receptor [Mimivirus sp.]WMV63179.1 putative serine/threonine-protein kinase/receptor [Acanthamoeba polyphaga mimivirus]WMV64156.1 putative serine/threonine-protein kinase/receptor [Mimivirus sp.]